MNKAKIVQEIYLKKSFLCIGLDVDLDKIPSHLKGGEDPIFEFNKAIIDATHHLAVAYKPNTAFYECYGTKGWESLKKTIDYLNEQHPDIFTIADAKRGDIGNTAARYAKAFFEQMNFDAITVAPYMGRDSVAPFLGFQDKQTILLGLTSNKGSNDFQKIINANGTPLYQNVIRMAHAWQNHENLMYVVGATQGVAFQEIRNIVPDAFLLVPGVGTQGGRLSEVCRYGMNKDVGLLVNSSRGIIYNGNGTDFALKAQEAAHALQQEMADILNTPRSIRLRAHHKL